MAARPQSSARTSATIFARARSRCRWCWRSAAATTPSERSGCARWSAARSATLPVVLAFRRGNDAERAFWVRALERGEIGDGDLDHAIGLMTKHRALEDTINRAQHYGAMAVDALALFPPSPMKDALEQVVAFCLARTY